MKNLHSNNNRTRIGIGILAFLLISALLLGYPSTVSADAGDNQINLALSQYNKAQYDLAASSYEKYVKDYPTHARRVEAAYYLAEAYLQLNRFDEAGTQFGYIFTNASSDNLYYKPALFRAGEVMYQRKQYDYARSLFEEFLSKYGGEKPDVLCGKVLPYLGQIALDEVGQNPDKAKESKYYFTNSLGLFPNGSMLKESQFGLGCAEILLGEYDSAEQILRPLIMDTNYSHAVEYQLGFLEFQRGNSDRAVQQLNTLYQKIQSFRRDAQKGEVYTKMSNDILRILARSYGDLGKYDQAINALGSINPSTDADQLLRVRFLYGKKSYQEAENLLSQLEKRPSADTVKDEINYLKAMIYADKNDWQSVQYILEQLLIARYDTYNKTMNVGYFEAKTTPGLTPSVKLGLDNFLQACSLLCLAYAEQGASDQAKATYTTLAHYAEDNNTRHRAILNSTFDDLSRVESSLANNGRPGAGNQGGTRPGGTWSQTGGTNQPNPLNPTNPLDPRENSGTALRPGGSGGNGGNVAGNGGLRPGGSRPGGIGSLEREPLVPIERPNTSDSGNSFIAGIGSQSNRPGSIDREREREVASMGDPRKDREHEDNLIDAENFFRKKQYEKADSILLALLKDSPSEEVTTKAALLRAKTVNAMGQERLANTIFEQLIDQYPESTEYPEALWLSGMYYEELGETEKSLRNFRKIVDRYPNSKFVDGANYHIAWDELNCGNEREAKSMLMKIYRKGENEYWSHATWMLAQFAYRDFDLERSEKYMKELFRGKIDQAIFDRVLFLKGQLSMESGKWEIASKAFYTLQEYCPDSELYHEAGEYYAEANNRKSTESIRR